MIINNLTNIIMNSAIEGTESAKSYWLYRMRIFFNRNIFHMICYILNYYFTYL